MSPQLPVTITGASTNVFRRHASAVSGGGPAWVVASGLRDIETLVITPQTLKAPPPSAPAGSKDEDEGDKDPGKGKTAAKGEAAAADAPAAAETPAASATAPAATLPALPPARYTVRLYFMEPDSIAPGRRVFDVLLQGQPALKDFDIVKTAGAAYCGVVKEFKNVQLSPQLEVRLQKSAASTLGPALSGVELVLEQQPR
ncbi:MAG: hypothetical protein HZA88_03120 [Verrucomicrobia bacterium]|nr:hypothetical protein [Verrucomicrobiota bacterium]